MAYTGRFLKPWHISGNLEDHAHVLCIRPGKTWEGLISKLLLTLWYFTGGRWSLMQWCKLPFTAKLLAPTHMQSHSVKTWRHQLKAFKKSFVQLFHDYYVNQAETSVATYEQKYRLYRISPEKPLNKQQQTTTTSNSNNNKPCKGGDMIYDIMKTIQSSTNKYKTCKETYTVGGGRVGNRKLDVWLVKDF